MLVKMSVRIMRIMFLRLFHRLRKVLRGILEMHQRGVKITEPTMVSRVTALSRKHPLLPTSACVELSDF